jgi:hypothetical protein
MLVYLLAIASGSGSLALFLTAFFLPEIHRKGDFLWSGIGLFYALVLWITAARIDGGLLLGETAGVALLVWAILQVLQTRWKSVPVEQRSAPSVELVNKLEKLFSEESLQKVQTQITELTAKAKQLVSKSTTPAPKVTSEVAPEVPPKASSESIPEATLEVIPEASPSSIAETTLETTKETSETSEIPPDQASSPGTEEPSPKVGEPVLPKPWSSSTPAPTPEPPED